MIITLLVEQYYFNLNKREGIMIHWEVPYTIELLVSNHIKLE